VPDQIAVASDPDDKPSVSRAPPESSATKQPATPEQQPVAPKKAARAKPKQWVKKPRGDWLNRRR
jgi:hypothetical protein